MLRKIILSFVVIAALIGAGIGFAYKDSVTLVLQMRAYHTKFDAGQYEQAYMIVDKLAQQGHENANYFIGVHYEGGHGVAQNMDMAIEHYKLAASAEYNWAQAHLGSLYMLGEGVEIDEKRAVYWLEKAAANDFPHAQYLLGKMYKNGTGVTQDTDKARTLLQAASVQGIQAANIDLAKMAALDMGLR